VDFNTHPFDEQAAKVYMPGVTRLRWQKCTTVLISFPAAARSAAREQQEWKGVKRKLFEKQLVFPSNCFLMTPLLRLLIVSCPFFSFKR
jgi:hypothetical protein